MQIKNNASYLNNLTWSAEKYTCLLNWVNQHNNEDQQRPWCQGSLKDVAGSPESHSMPLWHQWFATNWQQVTKSKVKKKYEKKF